MQAEGLDAHDAAERLAGNAQTDHRVYTEWDGELGAGKARLWSLDTARAACSALPADGPPIRTALILVSGLWCGIMSRRRR